MRFSLGQRIGAALPSLVFICGNFSLAPEAGATVHDGGEYSISKVQSKVDLGSEDKESPVTNFAFEEDRRNHAPIGKPFYALDSDGKCYWANFAYSKYELTLVVYRKSPVLPAKCVYQKSVDTYAKGYSISIKEGGICVPSLAEGGETQGKRWDVKETGSPVAFSECASQEISFGDRLESSTYLAEASPPPPPTEVKTEPAARVISSPEQPKPKPVIGGFTLQISSFLDQKNAEAKISELKAQGIEAFQVSSQVDGKTRFQVCTGHFTSRNAALKGRKSLDRSISAGAFIKALDQGTASL